MNKKNKIAIQLSLTALALALSQSAFAQLSDCYSLGNSMQNCVQTGTNNITEQSNAVSNIGQSQPQSSNQIPFSNTVDSSGYATNGFTKTTMDQSVIDNRNSYQSGGQAYTNSINEENTKNANLAAMRSTMQNQTSGNVVVGPSVAPVVFAPVTSQQNNTNGFTKTTMDQSVIDNRNSYQSGGQAYTNSINEENTKNANLAAMRSTMSK
jgi:dihydrofolate reductase